jgi:hypothetical protein
VLVPIHLLMLWILQQFHHCTTYVLKYSDVSILQNSQSDPVQPVRKREIQNLRDSLFFIFQKSSDSNPQISIFQIHENHE